MSKLSDMWEQFKTFAETQLGEVQRKIKEVDSWDGAASNYADTGAYCDACLINVNGAAGKTDRADWSQSHCMLPVKTPGDSMMTDKGVMAAAGGRGISRVKKPDDVSQEDWDKAVTDAAKKLTAAYKEMEMETPPSVEAKMRAVSTHALEEMAYKLSYEKYPMAMVHSVFIDDDGRLFVILSQEMKLYRSELAFDNGNLSISEWQEVTQEFPVKTRTTFSQQPNGKTRWLSISATAVINREAEIDSKALFDSFAEYAEKTGKYPVRRFFHLKGDKFILGQADFVARHGNCYITSGELNDTDLAKSEVEARVKEPEYWSESIGYYPTSDPEFIKVRGFNVPVYKTGINVEISVLPKKEAAHLFLRTEVKRAMEQRQLEALARLHFGGDLEAAQKYVEENPEEVNRQIDEAGLITRNTTGAGVGEVELTEELVTVIVQRMAENEVVKTLRETVEAQAATIQTLQGELEQLKVANANLDVRLQPLERSKTEIERQARLDLPAAATIKVGFKPTEQRGAQQEVNSKQVAESTLDSIGLKY